VAEFETDLTELSKGFVTLTPLQYNMTEPRAMAELQEWGLRLPG
jgi:hypothetical protein